ncbi:MULTISPECIES: aminotransferase class I/II-fold pyridoxal phosphate-dependent enzyme [unclassified Halomonas]|uniref:aminotransferase class I/II-fold pyridoxal phosphate-dependent enzyme n=1 Tax=unclassified Halomonas TaxID=2609666 RepID=UPI0005FA32CD|nr:MULTISPECIES: aminotransferase class I/II-fold pyridoxal phosphate-dependent enzyme [unclassified Halomonas]KJZ05766.1 8-amino-7-oxononanoate synthase [Halomonas sp. S2151]MCO7214712.1 aminotransferase class I/II-fold pyridoxal phosphate-dependent enzyme [Halomonas sp. OfavH-34-E]
MNPDDRKALKDRLLNQARAIDSARHAQATPIDRAVSTSEHYPLTETLVATTDFRSLEGYRRIAMMRTLGDSLGITSPFFRCHQRRAGATSRLGDQDVINFANYDYLGLAGDRRVLDATHQAIEYYGTSVSASRIVAGERPFHGALERELAHCYQSDDALAFVSGHATNVSTIAMLVGTRDLIIHDSLIHNSVVVGASVSGATRMSFPHNDAQALDRLLFDHRDRFERVLVVIEGHYSMDGDTPDLARFVEVKRRHHCWLMVDEAHSLGVLGTTGLGLHQHCRVAPGDVDIWMGTLSKSLASCGGYIAGCQALVDTLRYLAPGFLYSVGLAPQLAAPARRALQVLQEEPWRTARLTQNARRLLDGIQSLGLNTGSSEGHAIVPLILGSSARAAKLSHALLAAGINVQPILHPAVPERSARLRFFVSCEHQPDQIDQTLSALERLINSD